MEISIQMKIPIYLKPKLIQYNFETDKTFVHHNPDTIYKFGYTEERDAALRFNPAVHKRKNHRGIAFGEDYNVQIKWSAFFPLAKSLAIEQLLLQNYPYKNVYTDRDYNGITECRVFSESEANLILRSLYGSLNNKRNYYKEGYYHVYFAKFTKKVPKDIFDDKPIITQPSLF